MFGSSKGNGLGDTPKFLGGEGTGIKLGMFEGDMLLQTYSVTEWVPPTRLVLTLDPWKWENAAYVEGKPLPGFLGKAIGSMKALESTYSFLLSSAGPGQTKLTVSIYYRFTHEIWGPIFHLAGWLPIKWAMQRCAANFLQYFTLSFDESKEEPRADG